MKNFLLRIWAVITVFFKKYPEFLTIPAGLVIWIASCNLLRWIDPSSGVFDSGVFQVPIFAIIQLFIFVAIAWLLMRIVFGTVTKHLKTDFKTEFTNLIPWQKLIISYGIFFALLYALILLSHTLIASR